MLVSRGGWTWTALIWKHFQHSILGEVWCWDELQETQPRQGRQSTYALTHPTLRAPFIRGINSEDKHEGNCRGSAPAGSRGILRMNGVGEKRHVRPAMMGPSLQGRDRERERERERETRLGYAAESGSCFIFHHHLCWFISKGQISIQT